MTYSYIKILPVFLLAICGILVPVDGAGYSSAFWQLESNWSYVGDTGPANWCQLGYSACCGKSQSPINLNSNHMSESLDAISMKHYSVMPQRMLARNNGDTVRLEFQYLPASKIPTVSFAWSSVKYLLDNVHFHWGANSSVGSEHLINGQRFPLEAHFVHRDSRYATADEASHHPSGVLVLSTLYKISPHTNNHLQGLMTDLHHVQFAGETYNDTMPFLLSNILPNLQDGNHYYTYNGSFTTPPCTESVKWVIFKEKVPISEHQMQSFRRLQTQPESYDPLRNHPLVNNYRPVQQLNNRSVDWALLPDRYL